jgi:hypothetical protein
MGRLEFGPGTARLLIRTGREGLAARAGHDLTLEVTRWSAVAETGDGGPSAASVTARIELDSLVVREGTGGAKPLTDGDRREIEKTAGGLLGERGDPVATFASERVVAMGRGGAIEGQVTAYGVGVPVRLQVTERGGTRRLATGTVRQSALGIKPYTGFLGALKVRDEVTVEIEFEAPA